MLSVWWSVRGITHWELLLNGCNITADVYCQQLDRVAAKLQGKQDKVYFLHDNARPHVAKSTRDKLLKLGWITIPHPPYSPDLAPTDYRLYHSLLDYLCEKRFDDENGLKMKLVKFFWTEVPGLLRTRDSFLARALATSRRQQWSIYC